MPSQMTTVVIAAVVTSTVLLLVVVVAVVVVTMVVVMVVVVCKRQRKGESNVIKCDCLMVSCIHIGKNKFICSHISCSTYIRMYDEIVLIIILLYIHKCCCLIGSGHAKVVHHMDVP